MGFVKLEIIHGIDIERNALYTAAGSSGYGGSNGNGGSSAHPAILKVGSSIKSESVGS